MAKKTFKDNLGKREYLNVINTDKKKKEVKEAPESIKQELAKPTYQPHTLKIRTDVWEISNALAWWERAKYQEFFTKVLETHIDSVDPRELKDIVEKYKTYKKRKKK